MSENVLVELIRDVTDVGLRLRVAIPSTWTEVAIEGAVLVVGGRLEDNDETLVPTVQLRVQAAEDAATAAEAVTGVVGVLRESVVLFERSGTDAGGLEETVAEIAHRSEVTNATQISMFRTIYLSDRHLAVSVVATCGGAASEEARDRLRDVVTSVTVSPSPGEAEG